MSYFYFMLRGYFSSILFLHFVFFFEKLSFLSICSIFDDNGGCEWIFLILTFIFKWQELPIAWQRTLQAQFTGQISAIEG